VSEYATERRGTRRRLCIPLRVEIRDEEGPIAVWATNLSTTGMGIQVESPYKPGSTLGVRFRVLPDSEWIEAEAEVVWCTGEDDLVPGLQYYEAGLRFLSTPEEAVEALNRFIEEAEFLRGRDSREGGEGR
jgi:c-di-GMP-binding flagellar brake protein YcgR